MKTIHQILGVLWIVISGYFCVSSSLATYDIIRVPDYHLISLIVFSLFTLLYLAGTVASFYILHNSRLGRIIVGAVALFTILASATGLLVFFSALPVSFVGIAFDIFAVASAGVLLFSRKYASA
jgi:hypothetical protein